MTYRKGYNLKYYFFNPFIPGEDIPCDLVILLH